MPPRIPSLEADDLISVRSRRAGRKERVTTYRVVRPGQAVIELEGPRGGWAALVVVERTGELELLRSALGEPSVPVLGVEVFRRLQQVAA